MAIKFEDFKHLYPVSKTLRFEAIPQGATLHNINKKGLLKKDELLADSYVKMKSLIDEYHKMYIDKALSGECLKPDILELYYKAYKTGDNKTKAEFNKTKKLLRKKIAEKLKADIAFNRMFGKELIKPYKNANTKEVHEADLIQFIDNADYSQLYSMSKSEAKALVNSFSEFTTYFIGFHKNRANMYTDEEKSTGIAYRLINENLPKFIDNMEAFNKIISIPEMKVNMRTLYSNLNEHLKLLSVTSIAEMFQLAYYDNVLTQKQIDAYNSVIGGKTDEGCGKKIPGINEYVNLYNQQHNEGKLPKLKMLYKQILSDRNSISWLPKKFCKPHEVLSAIDECYMRLCDNVLGNRNLKSMLLSLSEYNTSGIFLRNDLLLTDISKKMFGNWRTIQDAIIAEIKQIAPAKKSKESEEKYEERISKIYKKADSFNIKYIDNCLTDVDENSKKIEEYFASLGAVNIDAVQSENLFAQIENAYTEAKPLLKSEYQAGKCLLQDKESVAKIKNLLDAMKSLQHFVKPLLGQGDERDKDERFYGELSLLWTELETITPLYDMVRNYMAQKPYSQEKIKLNFENSQLLNGWDANKESVYASILLRRESKYYLAIMDTKSKKLLSSAMPADGECYEKMVYKLLPDPKKMLPKVFFAKSRLKDFNPSEQILKIYKEETHKTSSDNFNINDCHALIDYFKQSIEKHEDWSKFGFKFSPTPTYSDINAFYQEVEQQGYMVSFAKVSASFIDKLVDEGKMYLFQLYNKDFSEKSKGTPNMHTLYWKALFDERNLANVVYKLNGQAELFYRKSSIMCERPTHPANKPIKNKNKYNRKHESIFNYDLIKDRRYTVDKFQFHVPITMNFKSFGDGYVNEIVSKYLKANNDMHIIGIDRGERHLLYLVVIDLHGNIKEQYSLNEIINEYNGNTYRTNYHDILDAREGERIKARQSWQTIESIKEIKEGYLSQVVHKIAQLMVKYHAIVALEDLNPGFMRGRQKVEKQVYQKFEKMLIDKLNYLVDKNLDATEDGGLFNAYQLTSKFESFQKLGKQSGFLFYIPAWNTSKIEPVTGFVNMFDMRYLNIEKAKLFFSKFDSIRYNASKDWFEFAFDYDNFSAKAEGTKTKWTLCTRGNRIETFRNPEKNYNWDNKDIVLTDGFKQHFANFQIDIYDNLKEAICKQNEKSFFETLLHLLKLTSQMRNSRTGTVEDYLISPVADNEGNFFDSRTCSDNLPKDADANGAYNIARKGLMCIRKIKESEDFLKLKLDISNKEWLNFAQQKPYENE